MPDLWGFAGHVLTWLFFWEQMIPTRTQVEEPWGLSTAAAISHSWAAWHLLWVLILCLLNFISSCN